MAYSGKYCPVNKDKYKGDWRKIKWRSRWEYKVLKHLDANPHVKWYSYETVIIPYKSTADGGKTRRYYMDFIVHYDNGLTALIEVKPYHETVMPSAPTKLTESAKMKFSKKAYTYQVNIDKWKTAEALCKDKGWKFFIVTEKNCGRMGLKF